MAATASIDGRREILGLEVVTAEDGAGCLASLRSLRARGLNGVELVIMLVRPEVHARATLLTVQPPGENAPDVEL